MEKKQKYLNLLAGFASIKLKFSICSIDLSGDSFPSKSRQFIKRFSQFIWFGRFAFVTWCFFDVCSQSFVVFFSTRKNNSTLSECANWSVNSNFYKVFNTVSEGTFYIKLFTLNRTIWRYFFVKKKRRNFASFFPISAWKTFCRSVLLAQV